MILGFSFPFDVFDKVLYSHESAYPTAATDCGIAMKKFFEDNRMEAVDSPQV